MQYFPEDKYIEKIVLEMPDDQLLTFKRGQFWFKSVSYMHVPSNFVDGFDFNVELVLGSFEMKFKGCRRLISDDGTTITFLGYSKGPARLVFHIDKDQPEIDRLSLEIATLKDSVARNERELDALKQKRAKK